MSSKRSHLILGLARRLEDTPKTGNHATAKPRILFPSSPEAADSPCPSMCSSFDSAEYSSFSKMLDRNSAVCSTGGEVDDSTLDVPTLTAACPDEGLYNLSDVGVATDIELCLETQNSEQASDQIVVQETPSEVNIQDNVGSVRQPNLKEIPRSDPNHSHEKQQSVTNDVQHVSPNGIVATNSPDTGVSNIEFINDPELYEALQQFEAQAHDLGLTGLSSPAREVASVVEEAPAPSENEIEETDRVLGHCVEKPNVRRRQRNPSQWQSSQRKEAVGKGLQHVTPKGKIIPAKTMKRPCLKSCKFKCLSKITEEQREAIFKSYWSLVEPERKWDFINNLTTIASPHKIQDPNAKYAKTRRTVYTLSIDGRKGKSFRVCSKMFFSTLGISDKVMRTLASKLSRSPIISPSKRGRHPNKKRQNLQPARDSVREHIKTFKPVDSRLCRANTKRKYLGTSLNITRMHKLYLQWMKIRHPEQTAVASKRMYNDIFNSEFNYGFHLPRKDQCELCNIQRLGNDFIKAKYQEKIAVHEKNKDVAFALSQTDKKESHADNQIVYAPFDLEKVLYTPKSESSCVYYLRKLSVLNFTVFDGTAYEGHCYVWDQTQAKRGANEVSSCLLLFMTKKVERCMVREFRLWADNCTGQNKNKYAFSMFTYACVKLNVKIVMRFLEKGHTHSEGDSMHACIDRRCNYEEIFCPQEWFDLIKDAKQEGKPYTVTPMNGKVLDFHNFAEKYQNWSGHKEVKWKQVRELIFDPSQPGKVAIRMDLTKPESVIIDVNKKGRGRPVNLATHTFAPAYNGPIPLPEPLAKDLANLCKNLTIPSQYHSFYSNLPGFPIGAARDLQEFINPEDVDPLPKAAESDVDEVDDQDDNVSMDSDSDTDYEEWDQFMDQLRKGRRKKNQNGDDDADEQGSGNEEADAEEESDGDDSEEWDGEN